MGNIAFKQEFDELNSIVTQIINNQEKKVFDCSNYTLVLESQLQKHLKIELQDLKDNIIFIPHINHVSPKNVLLKKDELCKLISRHYKKVIEILSLIKHVYDLEHSGKNSLAGMTIRNIRVDKKNIMELSYCLMMQHFNTENFIDFKHLAGFEYFCEKFLDPIEKETFIFNTKMLFGRKKKEDLAKYMTCGDSLLTSDDYKNILRQNNKCDKKTKENFGAIIRKNIADDDKKNRYNVTVKKNNPVLHWNACGEKRIILIDLKVSTSTKVLKLYKTMTNNYVKNVNEVLKCVLLIVDNTNNKQYVLKHLDTETLNNIQTKIKKLIAKFYLQSIGDFHALMDEAKRVPHFALNEKDVAASNR